MIHSLNKLLLVAAVLVVGSLLPVTGASAASTAAGQTRVIVQLAVSDSAPDRAAAIAQVTDGLLASLPAGDYSVVYRPSALPYLTLSAGPSVMSVLQSSSLVVSVENDEAVSAAASKRAKRKCKKVRLGDGSLVKLCKKVKKSQIH